MIARCLTSAVLLGTSVYAVVELHGPRDRFWKHHVQNETLTSDGVNHYHNIKNCLDSKLTDQEKQEIETQRADRKLGLKLEDPETEQIVLVAVENAITPVHTKALQSLSHCVQEFIPKTYEVRAMYKEFELDEDPGLGGNTPTHLAPLVGVFLPAVADEMQRTLEFAYDNAEWEEYLAENGYRFREALPDPKDVGFRATEHLTYKDFMEGLDGHYDGRDTYYTFNYAFSGPADYAGGYFWFRYGEEGEDGHKLNEIFLKPNKYDALIFLGGRYEHGVTEISAGVREMFSSEMWGYPDAPFGSNLWNNNADTMEEYIKRCDAEIEQGYTGPCTVDMWEMGRHVNKDDGGLYSPANNSQQMPATSNMKPVQVRTNMPLTEVLVSRINMDTPVQSPRLPHGWKLSSD